MSSCADATSRLRPCRPPFTLTNEPICWRRRSARRRPSICAPRCIDPCHSPAEHPDKKKSLKTFSFVVASLLPSALLLPACCSPPGACCHLSRVGGGGQFFPGFGHGTVLGKKARHNEKRKAGGIEEETHERQKGRQGSGVEAPQSIKIATRRSEREGVPGSTPHKGGSIS